MSNLSKSGKYRLGIDMTFSPDKSFSMFWGAGTVKQKEQLDKIHVDAVNSIVEHYKHNNKNNKGGK